jgi:hypothetical protein
MSGVFHSHFYGMVAMLDHWLTKIFPNAVTTELSTVKLALRALEFLPQSV